MSFYGNILKEIKENFFSTFSFVNGKPISENEKSSFSIQANYQNDDLTFSADNQWILFEKGSNDNEVILKHGTPNKNELNKIVKKIKYLKKDNTQEEPFEVEYSFSNNPNIMEPIDVSLTNQNINIITSAHDETGHINNVEINHNIQTNVNFESEQRKLSDNNLQEDIDSTQKKINILVGKPENDKTPWVEEDDKKSVRNIAIDVATTSTGELTNAINKNQDNIIKYSNDSLIELQKYADAKLDYNMTNIGSKIRLVGSLTKDGILEINFDKKEA